jgi:isochorismate pyruvate lyase
MKPAAQVTSMPELRTQIDALDAELVRLLAVRLEHIDRAAVLKQAEGLPARIPARVEEVVANVRALALERHLDPDLAEQIWRMLIEWSIRREMAVMGE